jgi:hypothetical protein
MATVRSPTILVIPLIPVHMIEDSFITGFHGSATGQPNQAIPTSNMGSLWMRVMQCAGATSWLWVYKVE